MTAKTPVDTKNLADIYNHLTKNNKDCKFSVKSGLVDLSVQNSMYTSKPVEFTIRFPRLKEINNIDNYVKKLTGKSLVERKWDIKYYG